MSLVDKIKKLFVKDLPTINSGFVKNIFFTYLLSDKKLRNGAIVLLEGLPSNPETKKDLMIRFYNEGYDVFFPRYEGSFESKGNFLERSPSEPIKEFILNLKKGLELKDIHYLVDKVYVLGSSFGGAVALDLANKYIADKVAVTSPVTSFKKTKGLDSLKDFLIKERSEDYRLYSENWIKLVNDELLNSYLNHKIKDPKDLFIITGSKDNEVLLEDVKDFAEDQGIQAFDVYDAGHLSLSKLTDPMFKSIVIFFS